MAENLEENEKNKFLTIFESLSIPVLIVNEEKEIEDMNNAALKLFEDEEAVEWLKNFINRSTKSNEMEISFQEEMHTNTIDRIFNVIVKRVFNQHGNFVARTIILNDITQHIEYDRLRKQFVSIVSHELRTPITAIDLSIKNLRKYGDKLKPEQFQKIIEIIGKSSKNLNDMIDDLLILSRVDAKKLTINKKEFSLVECLKDTVFELEPKANSKKINLSLTIANDLLEKTEDNRDKSTFFGDKIRISQIIRILVDNAIKYSKQETEVKILIEKINEELRKGYLIQIIDQGIGIKEEDVKRLFARFFRSEDVKNIGGTGIGLSIAKELVELHDGEISIQSNYGEGSNFIVYLPLLSPDEE